MARLLKSTIMLSYMAQKLFYALTIARTGYKGGGSDVHCLEVYFRLTHALWELPIYTDTEVT